MNACWQMGWNAHNAAVFPPWSQQLSALTGLLFLHSWIRGAHIMQKVNKQLIKVTCGWRKPPSRSSRPRSHCLYDSLSHVLAPRAIYLPLVFVFPASNVSFLLPLNHSVNFQKPVKSPHWPHGGGGGGGQSSSSLLQSIQLMVHETLLVVEKTQRLQIPPVHLHSTWKNKQRFFWVFYKLQPKLNYFLLSSS